MLPHHPAYKPPARRCLGPRIWNPVQRSEIFSTVTPVPIFWRKPAACDSLGAFVRGLISWTFPRFKQEM